MSKGENWQKRNQYMEQYGYPQPEVLPGFASTSGWVHVPPQTMPWGLPSNPPVVRFTAGDVMSQQHPVKRKSNSEYELRPSKQLVTAEKMAAHMSNLHISDVDIPAFAREDEAMEEERLPRLFVCEELKNIKSEPLIPEAILNKIERPKMAVVLWKPPSDDLENKLLEIKKMNEKEEKDASMETENNNVENNTFRPIDPVPMHSAQHNSFLQPTPQFHGHFPYS